MLQAVEEENSNVNIVTIVWQMDEHDANTLPESIPSVKVRGSHWGGMSKNIFRLAVDSWSKRLCELYTATDPHVVFIVKAGFRVDKATLAKVNHLIQAYGKTLHDGRGTNEPFWWLWEKGPAGMLRPEATVWDSQVNKLAHRLVPDYRYPWQLC